MNQTSKNNDLPSQHYLNIWYSSGLVITLLGGLGNVWFILVVAIDKLWKNVSYQLMIVLMVADFIINFVCFPIEETQTYVYLSSKIANLGNKNAHRYVGNDLFCYFEGSMLLVCGCISNLSQMWVGVIRCIGVNFPFFFREYITTNFISILISVGILLPTIGYFYGGLMNLIYFELDKKIGDCTETVKGSKILNDLRNSLFVFIPLIIGLLSYVLIVARIVSTPFGSNNRKQLLIRSRGSLAMCVNMIFFGTAIIVYWVHNVSRMSIVNNLSEKYALRVSYAINPLFYLALDSNMRKASVRTFKKLLQRTRKTSQVTSSLAKTDT